MRSRRIQPLAALLATALLAAACEGEPVDGSARRQAAKARLESVVGPFPESPAGGEAGARLRQAVAAVATERELRAVLRRLMVQAVKDWTATDAATLEDALGSRAAALAAVSAAAAAEPGGLGIPVPLPDDAFSSLQPLLSTTRLLTLEGRAALRRGDGQRALAVAVTSVRLLRAAQSEPWTMTQMLAGHLERDTLELLAEAIAVGDRPAVAALAGGLRRLDELPDLAWIAGDASIAARAIDRRDESLSPELAAQEAAVADLIVARAFERNAEMAAALVAGPAAFRAWSESFQREQEARRREGFPAHVARWLMSRRSQAEFTADSIADMLVDPGNAAKRLAALPSRQLAVAAADLALREVAASDPGESIATPAIDGEVPRRERRDGSTYLALPGAMAAWREGFGRAELVPLRFEWEIPSPPAQSSNRNRGAPTSLPRS